ncbi:seryl-tRNA synthetase [Spiroplasma gladiatoris]|uniref:Serine--tRNA ligase n=1 Tax=Spiroplasma gladiatoris TaxID=2143 RepID=A0A4P7AHP6_9MOLU|nr:serine--tRNA ligase [Spiroplasma gladiatoris]QBQ07206.1 seryl-tRNA synthetase [Spiroplasma gladiatoris]
MIDINRIENEFENVLKQLNKRQNDYTDKLQSILDLNKKRKTIIKEVEDLKAKKNKYSKEIGTLAREKKIDQQEQLKTKVIEINQIIESLDTNLKTLEINLNKELLQIPNIPNEKMPEGKDDEDNIEIKTWLTPNMKSNNEAHWDIATKLKLVDFELGVKISGSRFLSYTGKGAKFVRVLADILIDRHVKNGYKEITLPILVNEENMLGTGQLPKFADDAYKVGDQYLIPTSEVSLTNIVRNEILEQKDLPIYLTSFSQCFRKESGSAGRDTKGMIRLHQFNKVEMVKICEPINSEKELEKMLNDAEECLQMFNLSYRVVELCCGDVGFSSQKTYDLEVWFPNQNKFREISSCSNCGDFQARRMMARYKNKEGKTDYVNTLNGSGLAIDRLFAAILENYYDGEKLILPEIMRPYFNNKEYID